MIGTQSSGWSGTGKMMIRRGNLSKRKKRLKREAKQLKIMVEKWGIPVLPWGTTERYFKQIEDDAIRLANEIWDRENNINR